MAQILPYSVGDSPHLEFQIVEPPSPDSNGLETSPDITGWTAKILWIPQTSGVRKVIAPCYIVDAPNATFGYDVPGGVLPGDPIPTVAPVGSFSQAATYIVKLVVLTANPDGSTGETLTTESLTVVVSNREQ